MKFETKAIRTQTETTQHREHSTPLFPTSSFVFNDAEQMQALFSGEEKGNIYSQFYGLFEKRRSHNCISGYFWLDL